MRLSAACSCGGLLVVVVGLLLLGIRVVIVQELRHRNRLIHRQLTHHAHCPVLGADFAADVAEMEHALGRSRRSRSRRRGLLVAAFVVAPHHRVVKLVLVILVIRVNQLPL